MNKLLIFTFLCFIQITVFTQTGKIRGQIYDDVGEPLFGATVQIKGTTEGSITDFDGKYTIDIKPGIYNLVISYISFAPQEISEVVVKANEVTVIDSKLKSQAIEGETFTITAKQARNTEAAIATIKRKSVNLIDGVSAKSLQKTGDNTAAQALRRVTGVSIRDGKDVYVRGLGDRYTKTILNGVSIPGLDPDRNSVQVDIFPSNIIDNIIVYKSFSPDLPGDFTGGMVNIVTKDFPEEFVFGISASLGYNPDMNLNADFLTYKGASNDKWGLGAKDKELPINAARLTPFPFVSEKGNRDLETLTKAFDVEMSAIKSNSFLDQNYSFSLGNQHDNVLGANTTVGYTVSMGYRNSYRYYDQVVFNNFEKDEDKSINALTLLDADTGSLGKNEVLWSALVSGSIKKEKSKYTLSYFHTQNGIKTATQLKQTSTGQSSTPGAILDKTVLYYNQRSISNILLTAKHFTNEKKFEFTTTLSPTKALNKEPDLRQTFFAVEDDTLFTLNVGDGARINRTYRNLEEINLNGMLDIKYNFEIGGRKSYIKAGGNYLYKNREFDVVQYFFQDVTSGSYSGNPDDLFLEENLFSAANTATTFKGIYVLGQIDSSNIYDAGLTVAAGYLMHDFPINSSLKVTYGARIEKSQMTYTGEKQTVLDPKTDVFDNTILLDELNILPSAAVVYAATDDINIRANYARTLARPSFKEKSGAEIYDAVTQITFIGNLDLEQTQIDNIDLRLEKFIGRRDIISLSGFYKYFRNPIEVVAFSEDAPDNITPRNVDYAKILGVELEVRKSLDFISEKLKDITIGGNTSFVTSEVEMTDQEYQGRLQEARDGENIERTRDFQGQPPFLINTFIGYSNFDNGIDVNLSYNVQGRSLAIVGIARIPDVYDEPFHNLSFKASKKLGGENKRHKFSLTVRNILNSKRERFYSSFGIGDHLFSTFQEGTQYSLGYSFTF